MIIAFTAVGITALLSYNHSDIVMDVPSVGKVEISDRDACMECGAFAWNCPFDAIEVEEGVGCATAIIMGFFTGEEPTCGSRGGLEFYE